MKKLKTVTVGIPAFNEAANIKKLLVSLLDQKQTNYILEKIIVISDGSTDSTVKQVKAIKNLIIKLVDSKARSGLNKTQNKIMEMSKSDILIIANADIMIKNKNFIDGLVTPFYGKQVPGIVCTELLALSSKTLMNKILCFNQQFKESVYKKISDQNNVYLCHGQLRAFSKKFYSKLRWDDNSPEDSYSYFSCLKKGFDFKYLTDVNFFYQTSQNIQDHILQSNRFIFGIDRLKEIFGKRYIEKSYKIPTKVFIDSFLKFTLKNPFLMFSYIGLMIYIRFFKKIPPIHHSRFEISITSKTLMGLLFFSQ